ncbi:superoxide dismutase family protein [Halobacillus salinarum]|uniref:Superoxide dismutase [Cu-Zn] n=1 Tax=Halobacillus salinarum TaxID=2932257 RepID=A0ABY4ENU4_9BACI|nr:superoxide dismutase family protein [Halobacillus salinarum]UOQ46065.1 superoxide dismutase family protein [Halobacillus salinarum]
MKIRTAALMFILLVSGCNADQRSPLESSFYNGAGDKIGTATLKEMPEGVQVKVKVEGLDPGPHAIHVHEFSKCKGPDFISAGNHFNPDSKQHGLMNAEGAHAGDLPNIEADSSGMAQAELMLSDATLKDSQKSLLRKEGTSLVIHSGVDDGLTQPAGNSGERIACAKITLDADQNETSDPTEPMEKQKKSK